MAQPALPRFRFRSLGSRLTVLYAGLFTAALMVVAVVAQVIIDRNARASVMAELVSSGTVYDRLWTLRQRSLAGAADVLARDFGFRSAVASGDEATIASALVSLRARAGVAHAMVIEGDGQVVGADGPLAVAVAAVPSTDQRDAVIVVGTDVYRLVLAPIMAPVEIGRVAFAIRLDAGELRGLQRLSSIPLEASILRQTPAGRWTGGEPAVPGSVALDRLVGQSTGAHPPTTLSLPGGKAFAIARPLRGPDGRVVAALLLRYPFAQAFAPYRPLQIGIGLAGLIGLILVVLGSGRLARGIARPLAALDAATQALEDGARSEVTIESDDEIGRLASSFNRMSAGIIEREVRITHMAFHDSLTGLPNRASMRQALEQAIARAERAGGSVAILCFDLDAFKTVNDTLGHPVGDALLQLIGDLLVELAPEAFVARLGGDEYAIVLADGFDADRPRALAQAIIDRLMHPVMAAGHQIVTGASVGIAIGPDDGSDAETLLKNADLALYRAKADGRSAFCFFETALDEAARRRHQLELDLRTAIRTGQFELYFQPIVDLSTDRVGCFEALLRWHHPTRGMVPPVEFIPVAEETGLIVALGEWVIHEACRAATLWPDAVRIAVNVSPLQFRSASFEAVVMQALSRSGLNPARLEVEITESIFLDGEDQVVNVLHRLRALGIRVALDDFGTGYSSLSYLRRFPFDKIKIDRAFVTQIAEDDSAAAIVRAIVALATALHMETTAEGVEDAAQLSSLRGQGCSSIQGYWFSRPLDAAGAAAYLQDEGLHAHDAIVSA
ncbi:MAG TPA: EAL domain-containing protein [Sphingomonas sp.]